MLSNLRDLLELLRREGEIVDIEEPVDPNLEIAEIHLKVIDQGGPALFFHNVKGSPFPVVTNLFGTKKRVDLAFDKSISELIPKALSLLHGDFPPTPSKLWKNRALLSRFLHLGLKNERGVPVMAHEISPPDLESIPFLKTWPDDGGFFLTLPLVMTKPPGGGPPNLGMYRIQRYSKEQTGLHFQIAKGGGYHYQMASDRNESLPVAIFLGGPPALLLSAIAPLPENVTELLLASFLLGKKLRAQEEPPYTILGECEFAMLGESPPHIRKLEGPFGDHYGYYSLAHDFPVFNCKKIYHRKNAIYPATVVGKPPQEDLFLGNYLQKLLAPLMKLTIPGVKDFWSYGETGFHSLGGAIVQERYFRESMSTSFRILGEGQLALTKCLLVTDQSLDLEDFPKMLTTVLERFVPETDLYIFSNLSLDTLDYTGPKLNQGSRMVLLGLGEKRRELPTSYKGDLPHPLRRALVYAPGALVLEAPPYTQYQDYQSLLEHPSFASFPLIILVDDALKTVASDSHFLWTVFTRFEPAADLYARKVSTHRHHLCYEMPLLIDARMKPTYPPEVLSDPAVERMVQDKWLKYFPK